MSPPTCTLLSMLPLGSRPSWTARVRSGGQPADGGWVERQPAGGGWVCLELTDRTSEQALRTARELVVRQPAMLSMAVLAAAPGLLAVVLPAHCRLPAPIVDELARRQAAVVWRQWPADAEPSSAGLVRPPLPTRPRADRPRPPVACAMSRRGSGS